MRKFLTVLRYEYAQVVKKKSFIVGIFLTPVLMAFFIILPSYFARKAPTATESVVIIDAGGIGIGDQLATGMGSYTLEGATTPAFEVKQIFTLSSDDSTRFRQLEDSLRTVINDKGLKYLIVIKSNAERSDSSVYLVTNSSNFTSISRFERKLSDVISSHRLRASNVNLPVDSVLNLTHRIDLTVRDTKGEAIPFEVRYFGALVLVMLIYIMILTYGMMVMRSVIEEKTSRIMEVMVSSVSPFQLMMGKVIGLGAAAFTSVAIWVVFGVALYFGSGALAIPIDPSTSKLIFHPVVVVFFVLFLISGYLLYSTLFALVGSIVNTEKEAQNYVMPITISIILPVILGLSVIQEPNSTLAMTLSFIPLFAPTMMMMRIVFVAPAATSFSPFSGILGESILAFLIVVLATIGIIWLTAKIFRIGILMYGKRPTLPELIKWLKY